MWNNDKPPPSHHHFNRWYVYHSQSWLVKMAWCFPLFFPQKTVFMGTKNQETMVNWVNSENIYICIAPWLFNVANWRITTLNRQIIKKTSINGPFSMAILNNHRVCIYIYMYTGWWFGTFFCVSMYWEEQSQLTNSYFSEGLKPPTR